MMKNINMVYGTGNDAKRIAELEAQLDVMSRNGQRVYVLEAKVAAQTETLKELQGLVQYNSPEHHVINEALAALIQEEGECPHQFHYFGSQETRRCVKCNKLEKGE